jgi:D-3-phosphoglycerate dehydrogenase
MTMNPTRQVLVTQRFFDQGTSAYLHSHSCEVRLAELPPGQADSDVPEEVLLQWLRGASGWIVGHARVTRSLLGALPELQVVARRGVGYERVDVAAVRELGRVATIAAGGNEATVADQTLGLMLALGRRFRECQQGMSQGVWSIPVGTDLFRKTVGVVGLGRIGRGVVKRLAGFEARILVHAPRHDEQLARTLGFEYADLQTILEQSDYLTLHAPLTPDTKFLIREETIRRMKPTAFLINTARGGLVEDRDLLAALQEKRIAGAGLDVYMSESDPAYQEVTRELAALANVITLPHAGASTHESLQRTNMIAAQCVVAVLDGTAMPSGCVIADGRAAPGRVG